MNCWSENFPLAAAPFEYNIGRDWFNSGSMGLRPSKQTYQNLSEMATKAVTGEIKIDTRGFPRLEDQAILNAYFVNNYYKLPKAYNMEKRIWQKERCGGAGGLPYDVLLARTVVIHFVHVPKPWQKAENDMVDDHDVELRRLSEEWTSRCAGSNNNKSDSRGFDARVLELRGRFRR